jgi:hypothetical protein
MKLHTFLTAVVALNAWVVPIYGSDQISDQIVAQLGVPEPGSVSDQETTQKQRNPAREHRTDQNTQVTLGGAKSFVTGEVLRIDGDFPFVKDDDSGDEVRLLVNKDTRKICKSGTASEPTYDRKAGGRIAKVNEVMNGNGLWFPDGPRFRMFL